MSDWARGRPATGPVLPEEYFHRPSPARMWNYLQGGKDHYPLDRTAGDAMAAEYPDIFELAKQTRRYLIRAARFVATEGDVRQFLDIGCGLPAPSDLENLHDVIQDVHPQGHVVYVDNDKVVLAHARALLTSLVPDAGPIDYIDSDVRDIRFILDEAAKTLDYTQPTTVCLLGILGHVADFDEACAVVDTVVSTVPSGSYLILADGLGAGAERPPGGATRNDTGIAANHQRTREPQLQHYLRALAVAEPGVLSVSAWRPTIAGTGAVRPVLQYGGVARKP